MCLNKYVPSTCCVLQTSNADVSVFISQAPSSLSALPLALVETADLEECFPLKKTVRIS